MTTFTNFFARAGPLATLFLAAAMALPLNGTATVNMVRSFHSASAHQRKTAMKSYGTFESYPAVWNDNEGYVLFDEKAGWKKMPVEELKMGAATMSEAKFKASYKGPPLPL